MIKQIIINEDNVVLACSVGGIIDGGVDVADIYNDVLCNPSKYRYIDGTFILRDDYIKPTEQAQLTIDDLAMAISDLAEMIGGIL